MMGWLPILILMLLSGLASYASFRAAYSVNPGFILVCVVFGALSLGLFGGLVNSL